MPNRAQDWFLPAEHDLQHAHRAREVDDHDNGHFTGPAFEYYGPMQSEQALNHAGDIVEFVRQALADA